MNILFFLTPKSEVAHVYEDDSLRQVLERMEHHGYTAVPILSKNGRYVGTITEGDLLWEMKERDFPTLHEMEEVSVMELRRRRDNQPVKAQAEVEDLIGKVINQNFVPVIDDKDVFIGIVTRKDIMLFLCEKKGRY